MSPSVKGFGCRPLTGDAANSGGRRPKASKGGNREKECAEGAGYKDCMVREAVETDAYGLEPTHNFNDPARLLLNGESNFRSPCDSKDLGVAKIAHSTTLARPVLPEGSSGMALINFLRVQNPNPAETSQFCSARQRHCQDLGEFGFAARRLRPS